MNIFKWSQCPIHYVLLLISDTGFVMFLYFSFSLAFMFDFWPSSTDVHVCGEVFFNVSGL